MRKRLNSFIKFIAFFSVFVFVLGFGTCLTSFTSKADGVATNIPEFTVSYPEPDTSDFSGYCCAIWQIDGTSTYYLNTYFWNLSPYETTSAVNFTMNIQANSRSISFYPTVSTSLYDWVLCEYSSTDTLNVHMNGLYKKSDNDSYTYTNNFRTLKAIVFKGNVSYCENNISGTISPVIHFNNSVDGPELNRLLNNILTQLQLTDSLTEYVYDKLVDIYGSNLDIKSKLDALEDLYEEILEEQKDSNTWLGKIWESIQELIKPSDASKDKTDEFNDSSQSQKNEIDDLNQQNQVSEPNADDLSNSVDANINMSDASEFSGVLSVITNNGYVLQMLLVSLSIVIVAYILFGKRD